MQFWSMKNRKKTAPFSPPRTRRRNRENDRSRQIRGHSREQWRWTRVRGSTLPLTHRTTVSLRYSLVSSFVEIENVLSNCRSVIFPGALPMLWLQQSASLPSEFSVVQAGQTVHRPVCTMQSLQWIVLSSIRIHEGSSSYGSTTNLSTIEIIQGGSKESESSNYRNQSHSGGRIGKSADVHVHHVGSHRGYWSVTVE